jgi:hypothetical protein
MDILYRLRVKINFINMEKTHSQKNIDNIIYNIKYKNTKKDRVFS